VDESEEVAPNMVVDFDAEGRVVGIEVLFVSDLPDANPMKLAYRILREASRRPHSCRYLTPTLSARA
jgi:uncharacterized protein YuzE